MKLFWVFLCLPLINGVSVSKSEVDKQVRSKRDAETSTTPAEIMTAVDKSEDYEEDYEEEDEEEDEENKPDEEKEETNENPNLTSEEAAYIRRYLAFLRSIPQRSRLRPIEPVQPTRGFNGIHDSGLERDSFEPHFGFRGYSRFEENSEDESPYRHRLGHHGRHFKQSWRNKVDYNGVRRGFIRGSERDDSDHGRPWHRRYGDNNDIDGDYDKHRRDRHGYRHGGDRRHKRYRKRDRNYTRRLWTSELTGPNGVKVNITDPPYSKKWSCPDTATLILLKPDGEKGREEYGLVKDLVEKAWTGSFGRSIQKVEKITNQCLWKKYRYRKAQISNDLGKNDVTETLLFYGIPAADLTAKTNEGFDERDLTLQSSDNGAAFDFTSSSSKADTKTTANAAGSKAMLICRVAIGNTKTVTSATRLAHAPVSFHSVKQGDNYAIYRGEQVYPEYLITYT